MSPVLLLVSVAVPRVTVPEPPKANCWLLLLKFNVPKLSTKLAPNWLAAEAETVAPDSILNVPLPMALTPADLFKIKVPASTVVPSVYVFAEEPLKVAVPVPILRTCRAWVALASPITPLIVIFREEAASRRNSRVTLPPLLVERFPLKLKSPEAATISSLRVAASPPVVLPMLIGMLS